MQLGSMDTKWYAALMLKQVDHIYCPLCIVPVAANRQ